MPQHTCTRLLQPRSFRSWFDRNRRQLQHKPLCGKALLKQLPTGMSIAKVCVRKRVCVCVQHKSACPCPVTVRRCVAHAEGALALQVSQVRG